MADLFTIEPTYITVLNFRESSTNSDISDIVWPIVSDDDIKKIIWKTEEIIDALIWDFWTEEIEWQSRIFPTIELWLPLDIQQATSILGTILYEWGILDGNAYEGQWSGSVKSETYRGHSVSYFGTWSQYLRANRFLNEEILTYLNSYLPSLSSKWYK